MKFLRTVRLDASDERVFPLAAGPGEPAVPGTFAFAAGDPAGLEGKERQAFRSGWLGTETFGRASLVAVAEVSEDDYEAVVRALAAHLMAHYGAPDVLAALPVARGEAEYAAELADHRINTLLAVERDLTEDGIVERFRVVTPASEGTHARIWSIKDE